MAGATVDLVFPPACAFCEEPSLPREDGTLLCPLCVGKLGHEELNLCPRCALPAPEAVVMDGKCPACRDQKYAFKAAQSLGPYEKDVRQAVLRMKHPMHEHLAMALGQRLAEVLAANRFAEIPDLVAPIPMPWLKRLYRGTSAAQTLGRSLAASARLPFAGDLLRCTRLFMKTQHFLTGTERKDNVKGAFAANRSYDISSARILLVDDVITTGATCDSAARALLKAGAAEVYAMSVARGTAM
jgi:ComF family protein